MKGAFAFLAPVAAAAANLSGEYDGSVPFILDMVLKFPGDNTVNFDQNVKVASTRIQCPTEKIAETDAEITFPEAPNDGDCMGDALRGQKKDVTKFKIEKTDADNLVFKSDGWPDLKLKKKALMVQKDCTVNAIGDGKCGESTMNCLYVGPAKLANKELKDGTCAAQGYTVATGETQTTSTPVGDIVITFYTKPSLATKAALSGEYDGSVPFILDMVLKFPGDNTVNFDQNVKVASTRIQCPTEKIAETDAEITFPEAPNDGDCMGDALRGQKKDVTKFKIEKTDAENLVFKSDGWPDLKLKKKSTDIMV